MKITTSKILVASLFSSFVCSRPAPEPNSAVIRADSPFEYIGCDAKLIPLIEGHLTDVQNLAAAAVSQAYPGNKYYDAFFGKVLNNQNRPSDQDIKARFEKLSRILSTQNDRAGSGGKFKFHCDYWNQPDQRCQGYGAPMMTETRTGVIWACRSFFQRQKRLRNISPPTPHIGLRPLDDYSPTGGLILHELTHAIWETEDMLLKDKRVMYGHELTLRGVKELGNRGFTKSRANADSYRMFATAAYWSRTVWSVDPDHLTSDGSGF